LSNNQFSGLKKFQEQVVANRSSPIIGLRPRLTRTTYTRYIALGAVD